VSLRIKYAWALLRAQSVNKLTINCTCSKSVRLTVSIFFLSCIGLLGLVITEFSLIFANEQNTVLIGLFL